MKAPKVTIPSQREAAEKETKRTTAQPPKVTAPAHLRTPKADEKIKGTARVEPSPVANSPLLAPVKRAQGSAYLTGGAPAPATPYAAGAQAGEKPAVEPVQTERPKEVMRSDRTRAFQLLGAQKVAQSPFPEAATRIAEARAANFKRLAGKDLGAEQKELDDLKSSRDTLDKAFRQAETEHDAIRIYDYPDSEEAYRAAVNAAGDKMSAAYAALEAADKAVAEKEKEIEKIRAAQFADIPNRDDFEVYAARGAAMKNNFVAPVKRAKDGDVIAMEIAEKLFPRSQGFSPTQSIYDKLTDQEARIYNYLLAKDNERGTNYASEYLSFMMDPMKARRGREQADLVKNSGILRPVATVGYGALSGFDRGVSGIAQNFSDEPLPVSPLQYGAGYVRDDLKDAGPKILGRSLGQIGFDLASTTGNMAPAIGMGMAFGPGVGTATTFASAGGNAYGEALAQGHDKRSARAYGVLAGASEAGLQYALGGISALGGKVVNSEAIQSSLNNIKSAVLRIPAKYAVAAAGEATEEYLQEILTPVFRNLALGENNEFKPVTEEAAYAALLAALSVGVMEGPRIVRTELSAGRPSIGQGGQTIYNAENQLRRGDGAFAPLNTVGARTDTETGVDTPSTPNPVEGAKNAPVEGAGGNVRLTEIDTAEYMATGKKKSVRDAKAAEVERGGKVVLTTAQETQEFIGDAIRGVAGQTTKAYGKIGAEMAGEIQAVSGSDIDVTGWFLELVPYDLRHAFEQHAKAKREGNIDLTEQDFLNIPDYIDSYDDILEVRTFRSGDREVVVGKKINGYSVIVELMSNNRKSLHFKNMWGLDTKTYESRYGKRSTVSHPDRSSVSANDPTEVYRDASSMDSIPQPPRVVNPDGWDTAAQNPVEGAENAPAEGDTVAARLEMMREHAQRGFGPSGETALLEVYDEKMAEEIDPAEAYGVFSRVYTDAMTGQETSEIAGAPKTLVEAAKIAAKYDLRAAQGTQQETQVSRSPGFNYDDAATRRFVSSLPEGVEERMDAVARDLGLTIRAVDSVFGGQANAQIVGSEILIDEHVADGVSYILGHEFTHRIQELAETEYSAFQAALDQGQLQDTAAKIASIYQEKGVEITEAQALDEATADMAGEMLQNGELLDEFIDRNRGNKTLLQRVREVFRAIIDKLTGAEKRRAQSAEGKLTAALETAAQNAQAVEDVQTEADAGARYSIGYDVNNTPFVTVEDDILEGVPKSEWVKRVKENLREKFPEGVTVGQSTIHIDGQSRKEMTFSRYTRYLMESEPDLYVDKLRATNNADEVLQATRNYVNEALAHPRKDNIQDFARGEVQLRVGERDYTAQVVVAMRSNGKMILYDILQLTPTTIQEKKSGAAITENPSPGADRSTASGFANSISQPDGDVNTNYSLKGTEHAERMVELEKENAALQAKYEQAMKQTRRSDAGKVSEAQVGRFAKVLMDHVGVKGDAKALGLKLQTMYDAVASGKDLDGAEFTYRDFRQMANDIAGDLVSRAVLQDNTLYEDYAALRAHIRDTRIVVDAETRANITDYADFRKRNMGRLRLAHGETGNIDLVYNELSREYPGLFDPELSYGQDQLERIAEVMEMVYARKEFNPWAGDMARATQTFANEIMEQFWDLPGQEATFADRQWRQREALKRRHMAEIQDAVRHEREKWKVQEQKLKKWYADKAAEQRAYKAESEARNRLLKLAARMKRMPVDNTNKTLIRELVGDLDTEARHLTGKKLTELTELRRYVEGKADPNSDTYDPDFILDKRTADNLRRLEMKHIDDMTLQDVKDLTQVLLNLENEIRTSKRLIGQEEARDVYQLGEQTVKDLRAVEGKEKRGVAAALDKHIVTETLSPIRQVRRMVGYKADSPLVKLTEGLDDGQRKMMDYQMRAGKPFERFAQDENFTKGFSGKDAKTVKITGWVRGKLQEVEITPAMRVSLWLHSQNDQNALHMRDGGVRVPDLELYRKGKLADAYAAGTVVKLSPEMAKNLWGQMTQTERAFAREAQRYFKEVSQPAINEVSRQLKGYDIAEVENYYPIRTDKNFGKAELETLKFDGTIEGMGFLKERQSFAHNPMYLEDVNTVVEQAIRMHGKYVGLAIPVRNFGKVWNVSVAVQTENGEWVSYGDSVQNAVQAVWGKTGYDYITKLMTDLQGGGKQASNWTKTMNKVRSNYAGAVLTLNASVAMKQAASYPTAAAVLGWGPLVKAMGDIGRVDLDLIAKYTPLQWYRSQGFSTKELGDIQNYGGLMKKVLGKKGLNWIQGIDLATTRKLWKASEYYVRDNSPSLKTGSEEYYRAVADIYNRVIEETQPNYTTMQRPQLLRSDDTLMGNLAMFKTQPFQNFNILYDAAGEYRAVMERAKAGEATKAEIKAARTNLSRAVTSQVGQLAVFAAMTMAWGMFRGRKDKYEDDEGNLTLWSALGGMGKDMLSGTASMVPFGTEVYEFGSSKLFGERYYGMEPVTIEAIGNAVTSLSKLGDTIWGTAQSVLKGEDVDWKGMRYQLDDSADDISKVAGVPYENVMNLFNAVARWALIGAKGKYLGEYAALQMTVNSEKNSKPYMDLLYEAMENDREAYDAMWSQMVKDGFDQKKIKDAMEDRMKKAQGVTKAAEMEERYVAPDDREVYERAIEQLTGSALGKRATEQQMKDAKADAYKFATRAGGEKDKERWDRWEAAGMDAGMYALYQLAEEMADKPNENGNLGTITNEEREAAIRSMAGLTDRERSALWKLAGGKEKSDPWR